PCAAGKNFLSSRVDLGLPDGGAPLRPGENCERAGLEGSPRSHEGCNPRTKIALLDVLFILNSPGAAVPPWFTTDGPAPSAVRPGPGAVAGGPPAGKSAARLWAVGGAGPAGPRHG